MVLKTNYRLMQVKNTGQSHYIEPAHLEYMEVIIHSQSFSLYCIVFRNCLCGT